MPNHLNQMVVALSVPGLNNRYGLPLLLKGNPGLAKTSLISRVCEMLDLPLSTTLVSITDPTDYAGLPYTEENADGIRVTRYATPPLATAIFDTMENGGVVFFDEINTGAPITQAAALRIVLEGVIGDTKVPDNVRFIAACNDPNYAPNADNLAPSLANRFGHIDWDGPSLESWTSYMLGTQDENLGITCRIPNRDELANEWENAFGQATNEVTSFLRRSASTANACPEAHEDDASGAWPSYRTWEMGARALAGARIFELDDSDTYGFISSFVGKSAALMFTNYLQEQDLPEPEDVLNDVEGYDIKGELKRLDRLRSVLFSCACYVAPKSEAEPVKDDLVPSMWRLLERVLTDAPDLIKDPAAQLLKRRVKRRTASAKKCLATLGQVMSAGGY